MKAEKHPVNILKEIDVLMDATTLVEENFKNIDSMASVRTTHTRSLALAMVNAVIRQRPLSANQRNKLLKVSRATWRNENFHVSSVIYAIAGICKMEDNERMLKETLHGALEICAVAQPHANWYDALEMVRDNEALELTSILNTL